MSGGAIHPQRCPTRQRQQARRRIRRAPPRRGNGRSRHRPRGQADAAGAGGCVGGVGHQFMRPVELSRAPDHRYVRCACRSMSTPPSWREEAQFPAISDRRQGGRCTAPARVGQHLMDQLGGRCPRVGISSSRAAAASRGAFNQRHAGVAENRDSRLLKSWAMPPARTLGFPALSVLHRISSVRPSSSDRSARHGARLDVEIAKYAGSVRCSLGSVHVFNSISEPCRQRHDNVSMKAST